MTFLKVIVAICICLFFAYEVYSLVVSLKLRKKAKSLIKEQQDKLNSQKPDIE